jgi:hypothetical protein
MAIKTVVVVVVVVVVTTTMMDIKISIAQHNTVLVRFTAEFNVNVKYLIEYFKFKFSVRFKAIAKCILNIWNNFLTARQRQNDTIYAWYNL